MQKYSSKQTSLNQLPKLAKGLLIDGNTILLDYGCGKGNKFQNYVQSLGGTFFGFDPYWKSEEENAIALNCKPNLVTCANVLNVIMEDEIVQNIVANLAEFKCMVVLQVYEGDKTGIGKETSKGYQRNQKADAYKEILELHFSEVKKKGNIFICK